MRKSKATYNPMQKYYARTPKDDARFNIVEEIGDSKDAKFYPQIKISGWNNECNVSFRLITGGGDTNKQDSSGTITTKSGNYESSFYPVDECGEHGGHEFETLITSKPSSNVLRYSVKSKNVTFNYQGELTAEDIALGCQRPENVVGSYAVYGAGKDNNSGGKDYYTGKLMHIYRPFAIDANGNKVWCELNINDAGTLMTVTIPQGFLDDAAYPVLVDPTLGYTSVGASTSNNAQPWAHGIYNLPANTNVESATIYGASSGTPFILGIYSDNSGTINTLIASSAGGTFDASAAWKTVSLTYSNSTSQNIWIAHNAGTGSLCTLWYDDTQTGYVWVADSNGAHNFSYPNLYSPFVVNVTVNNRRYSTYITYSAVATGLPKTLPLLDFNLYGSPLLPQSKSSINLQLLDFVQFGSPFAANNISTGGASYSMTADNGAFNEAGQDVGLRAARKIAADSGSFNEAGQDAALRRGYSMTAASGSFNEAGQDAALRIGRKMTAANGAYTLSMTAAGLRRGCRVVASNGALTLSMTAAGLRIGRKMTAATGAFNEAGQDAALRIARKMTSATVAFVLAGQDVTFQSTGGGYSMVAASGSFTLGMTAAGLKATRTMTAGSGSFALAMTDATLRTARKIVAASASFALSLTQAALQLGRRITAASGAFTEAGQDVNLKATRKVTAASGALTLGMTATGLQYGRKMAAANGAYSLAMQTANIRSGRVVNSESASYILAGEDVGFQNTIAVVTVTGRLKIVPYYYTTSTRAQTNVTAERHSSQTCTVRA
jgi:hypothetical protein